MTGFRPFFNPATGEWIEYTTVAEDTGGALVRFNWRSMPGGGITEHVHPHQEERFIVLAGEAHFTLDGQQHVARAGETVVVPAGVRHSGGNPGPGEITAVVELRPAQRSKEFHEAVAGLVADGRTTRRGAPRNPLQPGATFWHFRREKPGHLTSQRHPEHHAPAAMGASENLPRAPLLPPLGQPGYDAVSTTAPRIACQESARRAGMVACQHGTEYRQDRTAAAGRRLSSAPGRVQDGSEVVRCGWTQLDLMGHDPKAASS